MSNESPYEFHQDKLGFKVKYLTTDRCAPDSLRLISSRALNKRMTNLSRHERRLRKPAIGLPTLVEYNSLSREWKNLIETTFGTAPKSIKKSFFAQHYFTDQEANRFYITYRYGDNKRLSPKLIEQYTYDASVLNTVLAVKKNRGAYARALGVTSFDIWQTLSNDVNAFTEVPHKLPTNKDALRKKAEKFRKHKYISVVSGKLQNINASRVRKDEQKALLDELLAKHTNLDYTTIASIYNTTADVVGWSRITAGTVANRSKKSVMTTYAGRNGLRALKHKLLMQVKRSRPTMPMIYWSADGWDVELAYQKQTKQKTGNSVTTYHNRLNVVVITDPFSYYPIGYAIGTHETPELIKTAFNNAFNHVKTLFGEYYMPYQLQTDHYAIKTLSPLYKSITKHFTPAEVKNAKSKTIENYFDKLNRKYCKLFDNWTGHNVDSGSKKQPNTEYLNLIKKQFPDEQENIKQIISIIETERTKKQKEYIKAFKEITPADAKEILSNEQYLYLFGQHTGYTNTLQGDGIRITIEGQKRWYDSFDSAFRNIAVTGESWDIAYDPNDLTKVLAVSSEGTHRFVLEEKYVQPMALYERKKGDAAQLQRVFNFNKQEREQIICQRAQNADIVQDFFTKTPQLNDTLAKHLLTDSRGQHKNNKSAERLAIAKQTEKTDKKQQKQIQKGYFQEQDEYLSAKVDINSFINQD